MAFNNWPWTNLQNLNLDWILNRVKEALTKSEEAKTTANGIASTANNAITLANGAIEIAEQARETAEDNELPNVDSNDYGKLLGVNQNGEWDTTFNPQEVVAVSERADYVVVSVTAVGGAFPQTVNVARSDRSVPAYSSSDSGKVLTVGSNGSPAWQTLSGGSGIFPIVATYVTGQNPYFTLNKNANDIYNAISSGMLPVIVYSSSQDQYSYYVLSSYDDDGEDVYIIFSKIGLLGINRVETLAYTESEGKAYRREFLTVPVSSVADAGKFCRVDSTGFPAWETVPSAESNSFGGGV